jgi:hypothetical protein
VSGREVSWIDVVSAAGLWAAVFVALFVWLWERVRRPKLTLRRAPAHLSVQQTEALTQHGISYPCYYCHLEVANRGPLAAREVEVFVSGVYRRVQGAWVLEEWFNPQWLWWTTIRTIAEGGRGIYLPTLPPHAARYVDLAHVHHPRYRREFPGEDHTHAAEAKTLLALDVAVTYRRAGHLLDPGDYKLTFQVAAANAAPRAFEVEITHTGDWHDDEAATRERGVVIGSVRAISGDAERLLATQGDEPP